MTKYFVIVLVAAGVRYANVLQNNMWREPLADKAQEEILLAQSLAAGNGYTSPFRNVDEFRDSPSAHSPPGYPFLLAGIIRGTGRISGDQRLPYRCSLALSILAGSASVAFISLAGERIAGKIGFWVTGAIASVWPTLVSTSGMLWDSSFSVLGVSCALAFATSGANCLLSQPAQCALGFACGIFTLFNPLVGPILFFAVSSRLFLGLGWKNMARDLVQVCGIWLLVLAPWTLRNALAFHRLIPIRHNFGLELWAGNQKEADGTTASASHWHPMDNREERRLIAEVGDDAYMKLKMGLAGQMIRDDPGIFFWKTLRRIRLFWLGDIARPSSFLGVKFPTWSGINILKVSIQAIILVLAAVGAWTLSSGPARWTCAFGIATLPLPYYVTHVSPNYRAFVDPIIILLGSAGLVAIIKRCTGAGTDGA